jgi:hypothetical protein
MAIYLVDSMMDICSLNIIRAQVKAKRNQDDCKHVIVQHQCKEMKLIVRMKLILKKYNCFLYK